MLFRQLFDPDTSTYSYLLADEAAGEAIIVDPVLSQHDQTLALVKELGLRLTWTVDTHAHADHITGADRLRQALGTQVAISAASGADHADRPLRHGDRIAFGAYALEARSTPGHTNGCMSFVMDADGEAPLVMTGDALLIGGCGRTDFQEGDSRQLYRSIQEQIFSLPKETKIYPGHDYHGRTSSTVARERASNPRIRDGVTEDEFVQIMADLELAPPRYLEVALPRNMNCGAEPWAPIDRRAGAPEVTTEWVAEHLGEVTVVDVREASELRSMPALLGARCVPTGQVLSAADAWDRDEPLVVVCRSGRRSLAVAGDLESMGFSRVASMRGGMMQWRAAPPRVAHQVGA